MALPSTNLTLHLDASVDTNIWRFYQAGTPFHNTTPADSDHIETWDDADGKDLSALFGDANTPQWISSTPLMEEPNVDFDGDYLYLWNIAGTVQQPISAVIGASAFVVLVAFRAEAGATNDANPYANDALLADGVTGGGYWGIHLRNNAGVYTLQCYNYDGSVDSVDLDVNIDVDYVLAFWHTGGSIYAEVYDHFGLVDSGNTASGDTANLTHQLAIAHNLATSTFNGKIGEVAFYNAYVGADKGNAVTYFRDKWVPVVVGVGIPVLSTINGTPAYSNDDVPVKLVGVAFTGTDLDGANGAFDVVSGFTFSNLSIAGGGLSGTVDIQIATAKASGSFNFSFTSDDGTSNDIAFVIADPAAPGPGATSLWGTIR